MSVSLVGAFGCDQILIGEQGAFTARGRIPEILAALDGVLYQLREIGGFLMVIVLVGPPRHYAQDREKLTIIFQLGGLFEQSGRSGGDELRGPALELLLILPGVSGTGASVQFGVGHHLRQVVEELKDAFVEIGNLVLDIRLLILHGNQKLEDLESFFLVGDSRGRVLGHGDYFVEFFCIVEYIRNFYL